MVIGLSGWLEAALSRGLILSAAKKEDARTFFHSTFQLLPTVLQYKAGQVPHTVSCTAVFCFALLQMFEE